MRDELELRRIRKRIDAIDSEIINLLKTRQKEARQAQKFKLEFGLPTVDIKREVTIINKYSTQLGTENNPVHLILRLCKWLYL